MPDHEKMYSLLFNATTNAIRLLQTAQQEKAVAEAIAILQQAQQNTEESYMSATEKAQ
ncbi:MAG: hypothetical protein FWH04_08755 [Oscillospiraceae bacterium]|nr:hypothetical protein [Oscillospiraceae bacterium]